MDSYVISESFYKGTILQMNCRKITISWWEHSGSVVECLTRDRGAAGSSLTGVTALCY